MFKNSWRKRTAVLCLLSLASPALSFANEPVSQVQNPSLERTALIKKNLSYGMRVILKLESEIEVTGSFEGFDPDHGLIRLEFFDAVMDRFSSDDFEVLSVQELIMFEQHRDPAYPFLGALILGGLGVAIGASGTLDSRQGGIQPFSTVLEPDTSGLVAVYLGFAGVVLGAFLGAVFAPVTETEHVLWSD